MNTEEIVLAPATVHLISKEQAWHYRILPKQKAGELLTVYAEHMADVSALTAELEILLNCQIEIEALSPGQVDRLLSTYYIKEEGKNLAPRQITGKQHDNFLLNLIAEAKGLKSSDIHIESYETRCRVRIRVDGMMIEKYLIDAEVYPELVNEIKVMAHLDIAEKRLPQDGRMHFDHQGQKLDIRVSVLPGLYGAKIVLRLLNNDAANLDLNKLGFSDFDLRNYLQGAKRPTGILLISGPTGSGKTTTLYATLKLLNKETRNILTIEDPVEYTLEGINQVQLKESIGLDFAAALRTFLRQDPDVIMVGEIRDVDTANMAIRAALTGHLVLSTIHTNSAWGTVSRLIDMGVPPFLVASTLNTTVAQRLVRLLCPDCKKQTAMNGDGYPRQFKPFSQVTLQWTPAGCDKCHYTGYRGRKAVYEVIPIDQDLALEIKNENMYIQSLLEERGIRTLARNAFDLFREGLTSLEEIYPLLLNF